MWPRFSTIGKQSIFVDDEEEIGWLVARFLEKAGLNAKSTTSVSSARIHIMEVNYQVYFLDLNLPDGTGFDLIPLINQQSKDARIIVISAYEGAVETQRLREFEINYFLKKPFTKQQVMNTVEDLIPTDE